ncbi:MAG: RDD family protein [Bacteroidota bacterium]
MDYNDVLDTEQDKAREEQRIADKGLRFANFIVDRILVEIFAAIIYVILGLTISDEILDFWLSEDPVSTLWTILIGFVFTVAYYTLFEFQFGGKTIGKMLTKTRAVKEDGGPITFKDALIRSLCRVIPFEPFSFFGDNGWHDSLSKTKVIRE